MPTLAGADSEPDRQVCFPCARRPKEDDIVLCRDEIESAQMRNGITLQTASVVEVELFWAIYGQGNERNGSGIRRRDFLARRLPAAGTRPEILRESNSLHVLVRSIVRRHHARSVL